MTASFLRQRRLLLRSPLLLVVVWMVVLLLTSGGRCFCNASITVVIDSSSSSSGKQHPQQHPRHFPSREDAIYGKSLWKGYEYNARLQYIPGNLPLCPTASATAATTAAAMTTAASIHSNNEDDSSHNTVEEWFDSKSYLQLQSSRNYTVVVPSDGLPVALLVQGSGGCSLQEKIDFATAHIRPAGLVHYLIVDGNDNDYNSDHDNNNDWNAQRTETRTREVTRKHESLFRRTVLGLGRKRHDDADMNDDDDLRRQDRHDESKRIDAPYYIQHISFKSEYELLDILIHAAKETNDAGGPRITIDSRTRYSSGNWEDSDASVLVALAAMISACACLFLMVVGSANEWDAAAADDPQQRSPPGRQRLSKEQVRAMLPVYRFDGEQLVLIPSKHHPQQSSSDAPAGADATSETEGLLPQPSNGLQQLPSTTTTTTTVLIDSFTTPPVVCSDLELCSICLDEYEAGDKLRVLPCNHAFHSRCIGKWLTERSAVCPLCKEDLYVEEEVEEEEDNEGNEVAVQPADSPRLSNEDESFWSRFFHVMRMSAVGGDNNSVTTLSVEPVAEVDTAATTLDEPLTDNTTTPTATTLATTTNTNDFLRRDWWSRMFPSRRNGRNATTTTNMQMLTEPLLISTTMTTLTDETEIDEALESITDATSRSAEVPVDPENQLCDSPSQQVVAGATTPLEQVVADTEFHRNLDVLEAGQVGSL